MSQHTRTTQEVFDHHVQALIARNLDEVVADYAENAFIITPEGVTRGRPAIRGLFANLLEALPNAQFAAKTLIIEGEVLFLEWTADSARNKVNDGVDTFLIRNGQIQAQTVKFTLTPK